MDREERISAINETNQRANVVQKVNAKITEELRMPQKFDNFRTNL